MKQIVMLQALCNNEQGWARVMSRFGRVTLVQLVGFKLTEHIEVWEDGQCVSCTPPKPSHFFTFLDEALFGLPMSLNALKRCWPVVRNQQTDLIIANANPMALTALFLRTIGKTRKVVCLVSDYFPPRGTLAVRVYRRIVAYFTTWLCRWSDEVWAVSPRIPTNKANPRTFIVPLCINDGGLLPGSREEIVYIGIPSPDHALDILFDICRRHGIRLNLIGESAYLQTIRHLAPPGTIFHGMISDPDKIKAISARCFCGYAVYRKTGPNNYSYFGIPSKMLNYFANGTPVITTDTADFTQKISESGIGLVVKPEPEEIERAVLDIKARFADYYNAISRFRETWNAGVEKFHSERLKALLEN
jgi:glycosyltransferase involved in cell wall biosynthesis